MSNLSQGSVDWCGVYILAAKRYYVLGVFVGTNTTHTGVIALGSISSLPLGDSSGGKAFSAFPAPISARLVSREGHGV